MNNEKMGDGCFVIILFALLLFCVFALIYAFQENTIGSSNKIIVDSGQVSTPKTSPTYEQWEYIARRSLERQSNLWTDYNNLLINRFIDNTKAEYDFIKRDLERGSK